MKPVYDALLDEVVLHEHGAGDTVDLTGYVQKAGSTMTGDLYFPANGYVMLDSNGVRWRVTVGTDGALTTTAITEGAIGSPWLFLFGNI